MAPLFGATLGRLGHQERGHVIAQSLDGGAATGVGLAALVPFPVPAPVPVPAPTGLFFRLLPAPLPRRLRTPSALRPGSLRPPGCRAWRVGGGRVGVGLAAGEAVVDVGGEMTNEQLVKAVEGKVILSWARDLLARPRSVDQ